MAAPVLPSSPRRLPPWPVLLGGVLAVVLFAVYPPFHLKSKKTVAQSATAAAATAFDPVNFVAGFWTNQLLPAATQAPAASALLADLRRDPVAAAKAHARRVGLGNAAYYFARGSGRVTAVERSRVLVEIDGVTVAVRTGPVFGNVVRDGCGLLEVNQVPGLAEFNAISAEINRLVEVQVQPSLKSGVTVGLKLAFAGCAEAPETLPVAGPLLTFIPVQAAVTP